MKLKWVTAVSLHLGLLLGEGILWKLLSALNTRNASGYETHRGRPCGTIWAFLFNCSFQTCETLILLLKGVFKGRKGRERLKDAKKHPFKFINII